MKRLSIIPVLVFLVLISCNKESSQTSQPHFKINFVPAKTNNELSELQDNPKSNVLRTLKDFDYAAASAGSPLRKLTLDQVAFIRSKIVIRSSGIVALEYATLKNNLNEDDFAEVMSWFGFDTKEGYWGFSKDPTVLEALDVQKSNSITQPSIYPEPVDYVNYYCFYPKSCIKNNGYICTHNC